MFFSSPSQTLVSLELHTGNSPGGHPLPTPASHCPPNAGKPELSEAEVKEISEAGKKLKYRRYWVKVRGTPTLVLSGTSNRLGIDQD